MTVRELIFLSNSCFKGIFLQFGFALYKLDSLSDTGGKKEWSKTKVAEDVDIVTFHPY